jgi:CHASE2 domain-containing sensor protein
MRGDSATSEDDYYDRRLAWRWTLLSPSFAVLMVFVLTIFDPFDFESATSRQSAIIFYKLYATLYPNTFQNNISVVLLDDSILTDWDEPWPPSHRLHSEILSTILSFEPMAVLVDMFFDYPRESDHFDMTEKVLKNARAPIFMIEASPSTGAPRLARPEVLAMAAQPGAKVTLVSAEVGDLQQPLLRLDSNPKPAALAVYLALCLQIAKATCPDPETWKPRGEMEVAWGLQPTDFNCERAANAPAPTRYVCDDLLSSLPGRLVQLLWESVVPRDWALTNPMPIPYHSVISANNLLDGGLRSKLMPLLKDRIVIYGADIPLEKDYVYSPVHGLIPGVFIHAMAIDNLLTFGDRFIHRSQGNETFRRDFTEFQPFLLMLVLAVAVTWNRYRLLGIYDHFSQEIELREADEKFLVIMRRILIGSALFIGLFVEFFIYHISPANWLAVIVVAHVAHRVEHLFFHPRSWIPYRAIALKDSGDDYQDFQSG